MQTHQSVINQDEHTKWLNDRARHAHALTVTLSRSVPMRTIIIDCNRAHSLFIFPYLYWPINIMPANNASWVAGRIPCFFLHKNNSRIKVILYNLVEPPDAHKYPRRFIDRNEILISVCVIIALNTASSNSWQVSTWAYLFDSYQDCATFIIILVDDDYDAGIVTHWSTPKGLLMSSSLCYYVILMHVNSQILWNCFAYLARIRY